jgi:hypothetical protein
LIDISKNIDNDRCHYLYEPALNPCQVLMAVESSGQGKRRSAKMNGIDDDQ